MASAAAAAAAKVAPGQRDRAIATATTQVRDYAFANDAQ